MSAPHQFLFASRLHFSLNRGFVTLLYFDLPTLNVGHQVGRVCVEGFLRGISIVGMRKPVIRGDQVVVLEVLLDPQGISPRWRSLAADCPAYLPCDFSSAAALRPTCYDPWDQAWPARPPSSFLLPSMSSSSADRSLRHSVRCTLCRDRRRAIQRWAQRRQQPHCCDVVTHRKIGGRHGFAWVSPPVSDKSDYSSHK